MGDLMVGDRTQAADTERVDIGCQGVDTVPLELLLGLQHSVEGDTYQGPVLASPGALLPPSGSV